MSRFVVGIDLGTTNSALAFVDTRDGTPEAPAPIRALPVPQLVGLGDVAERPVLPSFLYLPADKEFPPGALDLPWKKKAADRVVGAFAREQGAKVPGRLVASAKSWLSHAGVDRKGAILPWSAPPDVPKVSPVEASAAYLAHLRDAWNATMGKSADDRLAKQDIFLTVPASFDAAARELTVEAARSAGLVNVTLIEEPQAAFYAWLAARGDFWRSHVKVGDLLLVCDVGGGTTDFTLIGVTERDGDLALERLAVGEHILLGGDNMDLTLAHAVAATLPGGMEGLDPIQRVALTYACRSAKEALFSDPGRQEAPVAVLGRGSKVVGGSVKTALDRATLERVLLDGFFPRSGPEELPARGRRLGLTEIGLPYASDPAITKHLARFLGQQAGSLHSEGVGPLRPSAVLFNGGVFKADILRGRVVDVLSSWSGDAVPMLEAADPDQAVALGAAYYGLVRQGKGIRIRGGVPRSYYIGIETAAPAVPGIPPPIKALCVVPMGMEEGTEADVPGPEFGLVVGEPAEFRFLASTTRRDDPIGSVLDRWAADELQELAPLETALGAGDGKEGEIVPVTLHAHVNEVGTLDLWCQSTRGPERWKLEYNVREPAEG